MPSTTFLRFVCLWACGMGMLCSPAWAEKADRDKPMQIEADAMRHDEAKLLTLFTGRVVAFKGTMVLRAARMEVQQDKQGRQVASLWAAANERVFFRQKREGVDEFTEGESEMAIYDSQADMVTLLKGAEIRIMRGTEMADQISGQKIVFNNSTEVMTVDGLPQEAKASDKGQQRVRAILTPRKALPDKTAPPANGPTLRTSPAKAEGQKP